MIKRSMTTGVITGLLLLSVLFLVLEPQVASAQSDDLRANCKADAAKVCPGVKPAGDQLINCLKQHENDVSTGCAKVIAAIKAKTGK